MSRRYIDPHLDPLRAPSNAGQHPHLVSSQRAKVNPQGMYEWRGQMAAPRPVQGPLGEATTVPVQTIQQAPQSDFWTLVVGFGLGALAAYWGYKAAQRSSGSTEEAEDREVRMMPPAPTTQLVVIPGGMGMTGEQVPQIIAASSPQLPAPIKEVAEVKSQGPKSVASAAGIAPPASEKPKKKRRVRLTSQARDESGKYLPAGTRKRKIREGSKEKK